MWQQGGSAEERMFEDANNWIKELYQRKFAGFNDWRLPTLEEAMSLVERERNNDDLYIDPVFNKKQDWIWTKDLFPGEWWAWIVLFDSGRCVSDYFDSGKYVRAVRSGHYDKSD